AGYIYFTDLANFNAGAGSISRVNTDGSGRKTIVSGLTGANSVTFDVTGGKMYFTAGGNPNTNLGGSLQRANPDGTNPEVLVSHPYFPVSVALDPANDKMY